ncbi:MAG: discoidin domain-containing protein [Planctomycetota bacterium]|jgi:hypothetical protein
MKCRGVVLILMFLLIGTSMVDAQEIVNLFDNPGFEEGTGTDVQEIPGWRLETYTMSFWLKGDPGPITLSPSRAEVNAAGQWGNLAQEVINPTPEWQEYHLTFVSPEDRVVMWQLLISNPGQTYYVDHARCYVGEYVPDQIGPKVQADSPYPFDGATDVPRDVVLSWAPGEFAPAVNGHRVYFGESFGDVNDGVGGVVQDANTYAPPERLNFETTYYWRVDEVNAPPGSTVFPGEIWSFTTEPVGYPIDGANITAIASSAGGADFSPEKTIDGSGLDADDLHSTTPTDMWVSGNEPQGAWIQYELDNVYKLHEMWVWNSNQVLEGLFGFGFKDVTVEYSTDGATWTAVADVPQFTKAPGTDGYAHDTTVDFGRAAAKYVKLTASSNWGGILPQFGLSEVRFFSIPVIAREPSPDSGATDMELDVTLAWRAGREAATHSVYLSDDYAAVADGTSPVTGLTEASHGPVALDLGKMYFWRVDEANDVETPAVWQGDIWNFTTIQSIVVDDFEDYNDYPPHEVYSTWSDGYEDPTNGSQAGNLVPPLMETAIVHAGQSMPLHLRGQQDGEWSAGLDGQRHRRIVPVVQG